MMPSLYLEKLNRKYGIADDITGRLLVGVVSV